MMTLWQNNFLNFFLYYWAFVILLKQFFFTALDSLIPPFLFNALNEKKCLETKINITISFPKTHTDWRIVN